MGRRHRRKEIVQRLSKVGGGKGEQTAHLYKVGAGTATAHAAWQVPQALLQVRIAAGEPTPAVTVPKLRVKQERVSKDRTRRRENKGKGGRTYTAPAALYQATVGTEQPAWQMP